jgi:hypothetical protein
MGCPGCLLSAIERQQSLKKTEKLAKHAAIKEQQPMVIYTLEDGSYDYMDWRKAKLAGIQPVNIISQFSQAADG